MEAKVSCRIKLEQELNKKLMLLPPQQVSARHSSEAPHVGIGLRETSMRVGTKLVSVGTCWAITA